MKKRIYLYILMGVTMKQHIHGSNHTKNDSLLMGNGHTYTVQLKTDTRHKHRSNSKHAINLDIRSPRDNRCQRVLDNDHNLYVVTHQLREGDNNNYRALSASPPPTKRDNDPAYENLYKKYTDLLRDHTRLRNEWREVNNEKPMRCCSLQNIGCYMLGTFITGIAGVSLYFGVLHK